MATHVSYRDGGKTSEEGFYRAFRKLLSAVGVMGSGDLAVSQRGAGANKSVDIAVGDAFFSYGNYAFFGWNTATLNDSSTVITDNTSGNDRIDAVVAYIDLTVISSASSDNPGALKFAVVAGTPAGSPSAPSDGTIQSAIGASNPFLRLANVAVANGFTSIVNANITDTRTKSSLGILLPNTYEASDHIDLVPGSSKLVKTAALYSFQGVDSYENHIVEQNIVRYILGNGSIALEETVTYPLALSKVTSIQLTPLGYRPSTDPTAIADFNNNMSNAGNIWSVNPKNITTTTVSVNIRAEIGFTFSSSNRYGYMLTVKGPLA